MENLTNIIASIPYYFWFIFTYLIFIGVKSLKDRVVYLPKIFIMPLVFCLIKCKAFFSKESIGFCLAIIISTIFSFIMHSKSLIEVIKSSRSVKLPGNYTSLIILMAFFVVKYLFGYWEATENNLAVKYSLFEYSQWLILRLLPRQVFI